ncbi:MAG: GNAT family N-acetyltransferase [archaeon]
MRTAIRKNRERFYKIIPVINKVIRAINSPSFRSHGRSRYSIIINGKKEFLDAEVHDFPGKFNITLTGSNQDIVGNVVVAKSNWSNLDRQVKPEFRGYNLGKLLFRLAEQEVSRQGANKIIIETYKSDVAAVALSLGYSLQPESLQELRDLLDIREEHPGNQEIIKKLQPEKDIFFPLQIKFFREIRKKS